MVHKEEKGRFRSPFLPYENKTIKNYLAPRALRAPVSLAEADLEEELRAADDLASVRCTDGLLRVADELRDDEAAFTAGAEERLLPDERTLLLGCAEEAGCEPRLLVLLRAAGALRFSVLLRVALAGRLGETRSTDGLAGLVAG